MQRKGMRVRSKHTHVLLLSQVGMPPPAPEEDDSALYERDMTTLEAQQVAGWLAVLAVCVLASGWLCCDMHTCCGTCCWAVQQWRISAVLCCAGCACTQLGVQVVGGGVGAVVA